MGLFDNTIRELNRLSQGVRAPLDVPTDDDEYLDRKCPATICQAEFKVLLDDWKAKVQQERAYCPICREVAPADCWNTDEQKEYFTQQFQAHIHKRFNQALAADVRKQPREAFLKFYAKPGVPPIVIPIEAADAYRQKFVCEECGCNYASIGVAFFCPACGHNSTVTAFDNTVETVRKVIEGLPAIRAALALQFDDDTAQDSLRQSLENSLERLVGAFQQLSEALFEKSPKAASIKRRKNVFQNLAESSDLWHQATGKRYEDFLSTLEMQDLTWLFQQRHLIAHRDGIVDQEYINKSGDPTYSVGQRIIIRESAVLRLADLVSTLAGELRKLV
jgi:hypothetical protein